MNLRKMVLYALAAILGVSLWSDWTQEHKKPAPPTTVAANAAPSNIPATFTPPTSVAATPKTATSTERTANVLATVKTDVLEFSFNSTGDISNAKLIHYPVSIEDPTPTQLFNDDPNNFYGMQSGLTNAPQKIVYQTEKNNYALAPNQNTLSVVLTAETSNGLTITKTFTFTRGSYAIQIDTKIQNNSGNTWQGSSYNQLEKLSGEGQTFGARGYDGAAISSPETPYEKLTYKYLRANNVDRNTFGGWIALQQHYFLTAWVPDQQTTHHYYSSSVNAAFGDEAIYTLGFVSPAVSLAPKQSTTLHSVLFVGPELADQLKPLAKGLDLTIDYGFLSPISQIIFWVLSEVEHFIGNWGWSIVIVTIMIKLLFFQLSEKSFKSMARMREVAPRLQALKERYGEDRQALSQATMEIYRKEKISPLGGCLPMIIQIPVFFALYYVLLESVQLRQADFIFWIHDLSTKDPYYVLPILMGISMFIQQKLTPAPVDSQQAKLMMFLPVIFTIFFATFPAGLVLYWLVNNCVQVLHQWWALKRFERAKILHKMKHK